MSEISDAVDRLGMAGTGFAALRPVVEAGRPWPLGDAAEGMGAEAGWGPTEVLAHVAEMLPFWLGEIERIVDGVPEPVPFGRTIDDPVRGATIARDRSLPPVELFGRIESSIGRYRRRLPEIGTADLGRRGLHPVRGEMTAGAVLERFVVSHAEEHVAQLRDSLAGRPNIAAVDGPTDDPARAR